MGTVGELEAVSEWANFNDPTVGFYCKRRNDMKKLETKNDIIEWAKVIVDAKGEKFTPMSKGDLYAVASFILEKEQEDSEKVVNAEGDGMDVPTAETPGMAEDGTVDQEKNDNSTEGWKDYEEKDYDLGEHPSRYVSCTRASYYSELQWSAQKVYDVFLKWCETNPQEANVMDFSNGTYNKGAAFAYWLQGRMS